MSSRPRMDLNERAAIGARLRKWRESAKRTQKDVADVLGVKQPTVSEYEHGSRSPTERTRRAIEKLTGGAICAHEWAPARDEAA